MRSVMVFACFSLCVVPATAQTVETVQADVGWGRSINVYVYKPEGQGPFPLLVMSHGSPRQPAARAKLGVNTFSTQARAYAAKGWVVAVPIRRGYGSSGGGWAEGYGSCQSPDYASGGLASAQDIRAAVTAVSANAAVDKNRVVLMGVSAGGWGSVAAASQGVPGLKAVINFAGGRGSMGPNTVCGEDNLVTASARLASSSVPQLWIYAQNDLFFGPELSRKMHAAFTGAGGRAEYVAAPAYGADGHSYFSAVGSWQGRVDAFLRQTGAKR